MKKMIKCPFKNKEKRNQYFKILEMYKTFHKVLFTKDGYRNNKNFAGYRFWLGYDEIKKGQGNYAGNIKSKETIGYIFYRAGRDIKKQERKNNNEDNFYQL